MEDKSQKDKISDKENEDDFMKIIRDSLGLKTKPTVPKFPINKKIQKKLLKEYYSNKQENKSEDNKIEKISEEDKKEIIKKVIYPSGIIKVLTKNGKNQIIDEVVDYKGIKENYISKIKKNLDKELIKLIENSFLLYNRRPIMRNLVKKPYSTKVLEEKILIWKYYIKNLTKDEKALLIRKLLYYIGKFSEKLYSEFIGIKEISKAYFIFLLKGRIKKDLSKGHKWCEWNQFYMMNDILGYDEDGNPKESKETSNNEDEMKALLLLQHQSLNIKNELNGTGFGYVFLKELKTIGDMYTNSSYIFKYIFNECFDILDNNNNKSIFIFGKIEPHRILWSYFVDYFIDDSFVMNFLIELKYIFGVYKQDNIVKFLHDLVLYRWNLYETLDNLKKSLEKLLGPEEIYDEKEKIEKMNNDDVMKYIEGDVKQKKKKKRKKKKNEDKINMINLTSVDKNCKNIDEEDDEEIDIDDSISIISEADSVLDSFKNDIIEETEFNIGNKIIPQLSSEFLNQFKK